MPIFARQLLRCAANQTPAAQQFNNVYFAGDIKSVLLSGVISSAYPFDFKIEVLQTRRGQGLEGYVNRGLTTCSEKRF